MKPLIKHLMWTFVLFVYSAIAVLWTVVIGINYVTIVVWIFWVIVFWIMEEMDYSKERQTTLDNVSGVAR